MKQKLDNCIGLLSKAKELVCLDEPKIELALEFLNKSQEIITEFDSLDVESKREFKEELLEIQSLAKIINFKLSKEKARLKTKALNGNKMMTALKGYSKP